MDIAKQAEALKTIQNRAETISILLNSLSREEYNRENLIDSYTFIVNILNQLPTETVTKTFLGELCSKIFAGETQRVVSSFENVKKEETKPKKTQTKSSLEKPETPKKRKTEEIETTTTKKRGRSKSKKPETPKKRKTSPKPKPISTKKSTFRNECCLSTEQISNIRNDLEKELTIVSSTGNIPVEGESWKNVYYRNYDLGEEIAKNQQGTSGLVELYFDDRQHQLILNCNFDKKGVDNNFYVSLSEYDTIDKLKISKEQKHALVVLMETIKNSGIVRELSQDEGTFGVKDKIIQIHTSDE